MDIFQALKKDHEKLKPLLDRLVKASQNDQNTKDLLDAIRDELIPHARAEEAVFYNSLRSIDEAKGKIAHSYQEHAEAETILRSMQAMEKINIEWTKAAEKLREGVLHHIQTEENEVFPLARSLLTDDETTAMAAAFERMKPEVREQGFMSNTLDMIANMMPQRFADQVRNLTGQERKGA